MRQHGDGRGRGPTRDERMTVPPDSAGRQSRLHAVLHAYLKDVAAGRRPDREGLLRAHPDLADELAALLGDEERLLRLAGAATQPAEPRPPLALPPAPGRRFGDYELLEELGRGGMGVVWKARQVSLNRLVAVKMILAGRLATPREVQHFQREAELAAGLDHPHIVPLYEVGECDGQHFYSMKFVAGGSLSGLLAAGAWPAAGPAGERQVARLLATVARAVHHAHQRGVLHLDLKPGNILLSPESGDGPAEPGDPSQTAPLNSELRTPHSELNPQVTD